MALQVKKAVAPFYKTLLSMFKYYCLTPSQSVRGAFSIQPNQFGKMMQDADFAGNFISVEEIGKIFVMVNFETDKVKHVFFSRNSLEPLTGRGGNVLLSRYATFHSDVKLDWRIV